MGMKISVSLPDEDITFVDEYSAKTAAASRSAVIHAAIKLLRDAELEEAYVAAWDEWYASGDAEFWDATAGDGLTDEDEGWTGK
jgi:Arc/MetJ-type ribon-helix-helix transcriptional regulator